MIPVWPFSIQMETIRTGAEHPETEYSKTEYSVLEHSETEYSETRQHIKYVITKN